MYSLKALIREFCTHSTDYGSSNFYPYIKSGMYVSLLTNLPPSPLPAWLLVRLFITVSATVVFRCFGKASLRCPPIRAIGPPPVCLHLAPTASGPTGLFVSSWPPFLMQDTKHDSLVPWVVCLNLAPLAPGSGWLILPHGSTTLGGGG